MPTSSKSKQAVKPARVAAPRPRKAAAKKAAKATPAENKGTLLGSAAGLLVGVMSEDAKNLLKDMVGNVLYDMLKEGWTQAAPVLANLIGALSFAQFVSLANHNTASGKAVTELEYDEWIDSLLTTAMYLRKHGATLDGSQDFWGASLKDIADAAAITLVDDVGRRSAFDVDELMGLTRAMLGKVHLGKTLRAGIIGGRRPGI